MSAPPKNHYPTELEILPQLLHIETDAKISAHRAGISMNNCQVEGCTRKVSKPEHSLCLEHWKAERSGQIKRCDKCQRWHDPASPCRAKDTASDPDDAPDEPGYLSSTKIGKHFGLSSRKINLILAELGWIEKYGNGWSPTDRGNAVGANVREGTKKRGSVPFVLWPASILGFPPFVASVKEQTGAELESPTSNRAPTRQSSDDFRVRLPGTVLTSDGHMVRSRAEAMIDNWLYMQGIVHAYERRLPIAEDCLCDFYIPRGKGVYIEFWGRESDPKYRERKAVKQALYARHGLQLIELGDAEIERLDDVLPRMLLRFGIESS
jgi:hypothetical protein